MEIKYKLSHAAEQDLRNIYAYGHQMWGAQQADIYFNAFFEAFIKISKQPEAYPEVNHIKPGYRRCVCGVDSIYFRVVDGCMEIMAVIGHQDIVGF